MAKPWAEVADSETFKSADAATKDAIRQQYFDQVIAPAAPKEKLDAVRQQFFSEASGKPSLAELTDKAQQEMVAEMSPFQRFMAATGKGMTDVATGLFQSPEEVKANRRRDAPLLATGAGMAGDVTGNIAATLPAMLVPGANTVLGAGAIGGLLGLAQPAETGLERTTNALTGAGVSGAVTAGARALPMLKNALVDTMTERGQGRIALNAIQRFASDPTAWLKSDTAPLVRGSMPTLAEASGDSGIAQLQRAAMSADPKTAAAFSDAAKTRQAARLDALTGISGEEGKKEFYTAARDTAAKELYDKAFAEVPTLTPWIKGQLSSLSGRPAFKSALGQAVEIAQNEGRKLDPNNVTQVLHYTKMALDDAASSAGAAGNKSAARGIADTRDKLVSLMESKDFSPSYREARDTYAQMSKPINQMDVGEALYKKLQPALSDFGAERTTPGSYAQAVREGDRTAKTATGYRGATLEGTLTPDQMKTVTSIGQDLGRFVKSQEAGKVPGSPTAQYLAGQNIMRQLMGPLGLPQSWAESFLSELVQRGTKFAGKSLGNPLESRIQEKLTEMLLNPDRAKVAYADMLARRERMEPVNALANKLLPPLAIGSGSYAAQQ